jgi:hypothetical protein
MEYRFGWMTESVERELFAIAGEGHARWTFEVRREIGKYGKCVRGTIFISDEGIRRIEDARRVKLAARNGNTNEFAERFKQKMESILGKFFEQVARDYADQRRVHFVTNEEIANLLKPKNSPEAIVAKPKNSPGRVLASAKAYAREAFGMSWDAMSKDWQDEALSLVSKILDATDGPTKELAGKIHELEAENARLENELAKRAGHAGILRANKHLTEALALARTKVSPDHPVQKEIDAILEGLGA